MPNPRACKDATCLHVEGPRGTLAPTDVLSADDDAIDLDRRRFVALRSAGLSVDRASVTDAIFERCDLSNGSVRRRASFSRVGFVECRMLGFSFGEDARFEDVIFERCALDDALFDGASLTRVAFVECRMQGAGFRGCRFENVGFEGCDLSNADFAGANTLTKSTLRFHRSLLAGTSLDGRLLGSLVVDTNAARAILTALGATLSEDPPHPSCSHR